MDRDQEQVVNSLPPGLTPDNTNTNKVNKMKKLPAGLEPEPASEDSSVPEVDMTKLNKSDDDSSKDGFWTSIRKAIGIPGSVDELDKAVSEAYSPSKHPISAYIPGSTIAGNLYNAAKQGMADSQKEGDEASENIRAGQPILPNLGKAAYGVVDKAIPGLTAVVGGPNFAKFGEQIAAKNYKGAAGTSAGVIAPLVVGKAIGSVAEGSADATKAAATTRKGVRIAGEELPETVSQSGNGNDFTNGMEKFLKGTFVGKPLKQVENAQQAGVQKGLANLAGKSSTPDAIEQNWFDAAADTRAKASPLYEQIKTETAAKGSPFTESEKVADSMLADEDFNKLPGVKKALAPIAEADTPSAKLDAIVKQVYGNTATFDSLQPTGKANIAKIAAEQGIDVNNLSGLSYEHFQQVRSNLADLAAHSKDPAVRYEVGQRLKAIDGGIGSDLVTHDAANSSNLASMNMKAKQLWAQNYAQQSFGKALQDTLSNQSTLEPRSISAHGLNSAINDLENSGQLDVLFGSAKAQNIQALKQLGAFLQRTNPGAQASSATGLAKLAMVYGALKIPMEVVMGNPKSAALYGGMVTSAGITAKILAKPGGAAALLAYLKAAPNSPTYAYLASNVQKLAQQVQTEDKTTSSPTGTATPNTHMFDPVAWQASNPKGDVKAAIAEAQRQGYQVKK